MGDADAGLVGVRDAAAHMKYRSVNPTTFESSPEAWSKFLEVVDRYRATIDDRTANLPDDIVKTTDLYKENLAWTNKLKNEGCTVLDLGNPNSLSDPSFFYELEKDILFP
jgi:hypothetical protein